MKKQKTVRQTMINIDLSDLEARAHKLDEQIEQSTITNDLAEIERADIRQKFRKRVGVLLKDDAGHRRPLLDERRFQLNAFEAPFMTNQEPEGCIFILCRGRLDSDCSVGYLFERNGVVIRAINTLPLNDAEDALILEPFNEIFTSRNDGLADMFGWLRRRGVVEKKAAEERLTILQRIKIG